MKKILTKALMSVVTACYWCFMFISLSVALSNNAMAYIDPSVMTYAIQVGAGVLVAIGAVVGVRWRRAKRKVQEKLEADIVEFSEEDQK